MLTDPIKNKIGYSSLTLYKNKHAEYEKTIPIRTIPVESNTELVGIEIEMENMPNYANPDFYWSAKKDGSLRNNGIEYVSIPLRGNQIEPALDYLKNIFDILENKPDFSKRTSTHMHLNVRDFTFEQLGNLLILYALFEKHFFKYTTHERETSLFCVPLYASNYLEHYKNFCSDSHGTTWSKYLALNILPVKPNDQTNCYGTVEFRHLHGTMDKKLLISFYNSMICLKQAAKEYTHNELLALLDELNSTSGYVSLYHQIFKSNIHDTMTQHDFEYCITQTKRAVFKDSYLDTILGAF